MFKYKYEIDQSFYALPEEEKQYLLEFVEPKPMTQDDLVNEMINEEKYIKIEKYLEEKEAQLAAGPSKSEAFKQDVLLKSNLKALKIYMKSIDLSFLDPGTYNLDELM